MSDLGLAQLETESEGVFLGRDYAKSRDFSDQVALEIDKEVSKILEECYEEAKKILAKNETLVLLLADNLMKHETLTKEQITSLVETGKLNPEDDKKDDNNDQGNETLTELKEEAKEKGIKGYSKMNKGELKDALEQEEK